MPEKRQTSVCWGRAARGGRGGKGEGVEGRESGRNRDVEMEKDMQEDDALEDQFAYAASDVFSM